MSLQPSLGAYRRRPLPTVALLPLREMIARIELARLETADPICPTCASRTPVPQTMKWCSGCGDVVPLERFSYDRSRGAGRRAICKTHDAAQSKAYRRKVAKNGGIGATGIVVRVSGHMGRTA